MGARESDPGSLALVLQGKNSVVEAAAAARAFGEAQWLTEVECARLCIIVEELIANLYEHGGLQDDDPVRINFDSEPDGIRVVIVDRGKPFDPRSRPRPAKRSDRGGGAGVDIVRAWAQITDYSTTDEGNCLALLLPIGRQF